MDQKKKEEVQNIIDKCLSEEPESPELHSLKTNILESCVRYWPNAEEASKRENLDPELSWERYKDTIKKAFSIGLPKE